MKKIIWSNFDIETSYIKPEYPDLFEYPLYKRTIEDNNQHLKDERINLDIQLSNSIICIADLGLWNGRKSGYKIIESGNIKDILYSEADYCEWYSDGYNIKCRQTYHDGTNYLEYRELKENSNKLLEYIYDNNINRKKINYYTKSIVNEVNKIYGW